MCAFSHHTHTPTPHAGVISISPVTGGCGWSQGISSIYTIPRSEKHPQPLTHIDASSRIKHKGSQADLGTHQAFASRRYASASWVRSGLSRRLDCGLRGASVGKGRAGPASSSLRPVPSPTPHRVPRAPVPRLRLGDLLPRRAQFLDATLRDKGVSLGSGFLLIQGHPWGGAACGDKDFSRLLPAMSSSIDARFAN